MNSLPDLRREHGFESLPLEGTFPAGLNGMFYRAGPSAFSIFGKPDGHLFDGDGAITAVRFANGRVLGGKQMTHARVPSGAKGPDKTRRQERCQGDFKGENR
jgi:carotenoid cleavage dioxygenase-like enzyme